MFFVFCKFYKKNGIFLCFFQVFVSFPNSNLDHPSAGCQGCQGSRSHRGDDGGLLSLPSEKTDSSAQKNDGGKRILSFPIGSMYGVFTYIWLIFMVNVVKYFIIRWILWVLKWSLFEGTC